jgi:hypothetical protein
MTGMALRMVRMFCLAVLVRARANLV